MMDIILILWTFTFLSCCSASAAADKRRPVLQNATTLAGHPVMLNCLMPVTDVQQHVVWLRPTDGLPVHTTAADDAGTAARFVVIGNATAGQHHLLIRYTVFPDDVGQWTCVSLTDSQLVQRTQLTVLVPPPTLVPEVIPVVVNKTQTPRFTSDVYTVSCVSHFAFPPVDLVWVKEHGPNVKYSVSPVRMLVSRAGTMSSRLTLLLTSANAASLFACNASHPTLAGRFGRQTVRFMLPSGAVEFTRAQAQQQQLVADVTESKSSDSVAAADSRLDAMDRVCLLTAVVLVASCFTIAIILSKCTSQWHFSTVTGQSLKSDNCSETVDGETTSMMQNHTATATAATAACDRDASCARRRPLVPRGDNCPLLMFAMMALLLISSLVFCFPLYLKGVTAPVTHTDEVQAVFAGSALWLDCTSLVQPVDSLVEVSWYRDDELLYYQYSVNDRVISYPPNTTAGVMFHARASSQSVGHVTLWPVMPRDAGVYSCRVVMSSGDDATDPERYKTTTVFVFTGMVVNYALLVCLSVAVISALLLIAVVLRYAVTCRCTSITSKHKETQDRTRDQVLYT